VSAILNLFIAVSRDLSKAIGEISSSRRNLWATSIARIIKINTRRTKLKTQSKRTARVIWSGGSPLKRLNTPVFTTEMPRAPEDRTTSDPFPLNLF
jgi:hypothetical protein